MPLDSVRTAQPLVSCIPPVKRERRAQTQGAHAGRCRLTVVSAMDEAEPEQDDMVYLERFYQQNPAGIEAAREWGVEGWGEADWAEKFGKILGTYKKKAEKAKKKGKEGAEADYKEILFGALNEKYGVDPRTLPPTSAVAAAVAAAEGPSEAEAAEGTDEAEAAAVAETMRAKLAEKKAAKDPRTLLPAGTEMPPGWIEPEPEPKLKLEPAPIPQPAAAAPVDRASATCTGSSVTEPALPLARRTLEAKAAEAVKVAEAAAEVRAVLGVHGAERCVERGDGRVAARDRAAGGGGQPEGLPLAPWS